MTYGFKSITYDEQLSELHKVNDWLVDLGIKTDESRFFKIIEINKLIVKHFNEKTLEKTIECGKC